MKTAEEFQALGDSVYHWSVYEPAVKCELACTAIKSRGGLVVIDPIPLSDLAWEELLAIAPLRAILLTNENHVRDSEQLRRKHRAPIVAGPLAHRDITELKPDIALLETERLYGIVPIAIPGATAGETAYLSEGGVLVLGDAVIHLDWEKGLELLPDKYCVDPEQNRASLRKLLNFDFHILTFAHGLPVISQAKEKWSAFMKTISVLLVFFITGFAGSLFAQNMDSNPGAPAAQSVPAPPRNIMPLSLNHKPNATPPPAELANAIAKFFNGLKAGDYANAYETFLAGSRLGEQKEKMSVFISKTQEAFGLYGALTDYEIFDNYSIGSNVIVVTYLSRHPVQPLRWRFIFYRPDKTWGIINMGFDDVLLDMLD
jgi:glyoxylase-like metal-dependent hydrolase (beta-lactamase superfamily II)